MKILSNKEYERLVRRVKTGEFLEKRYNAILNSPCIDLENAIAAILTTMEMSEIEIDNRLLYHNEVRNIEVINTPHNNTTIIKIRRKEEG